MSLKDDIERVEARLYEDGTDLDEIAFRRLRARLEAAEKVAEEIRHYVASPQHGGIGWRTAAQWADRLSPPDQQQPKTEEVMPNAGLDAGTVQVAGAIQTTATEPAVSSAATLPRSIPNPVVDYVDTDPAAADLAADASGQERPQCAICDDPACDDHEVTYTDDDCMSIAEREAFADEYIKTRGNPSPSCESVAATAKPVGVAIYIPHLKQQRIVGGGRLQEISLEIYMQEVDIQSSADHRVSRAYVTATEYFLALISRDSIDADRGRLNAVIRSIENDRDAKAEECERLKRAVNDMRERLRMIREFSACELSYPGVPNGQ